MKWFCLSVMLLALGCNGKVTPPGEETPQTPSETTNPAADVEMDKGMVQTPKEVTTSSGLKYIDLKVGDGKSPQKGQVVEVHYTGWLTDETKFDSSHDRNQTFKFPLGRGRVIKGWDEGVASMKVGGKRRLIIPSELGYGARGAGGGRIPPGATLIFEVELIGIK